MRPLLFSVGCGSTSRASEGDPDAIVEVIMDASRHIVSTTVTTFGGFLPLILEGSEFWPPFAMAIAGGVLLSTVVSFYLVPPLYTLLMHPKRHFFHHDQFQTISFSTTVTGPAPAKQTNPRHRQPQFGVTIMSASLSPTIMATCAMR